MCVCVCVCVCTSELELRQDGLKCPQYFGLALRGHSNRTSMQMEKEKKKKTILICSEYFGGIGLPRGYQHMDFNVHIVVHGF